MVRNDRLAVNWNKLDRSLVDPDIFYVVRATCLLESRADSYGDYLERVLPAQHAEKVRRWSAEEAQHGRLLREWVERVDPGFDFERRFERYNKLPYHEGATESVRGSAYLELQARCIVEAMASGYYRAIRDATAEPVLRDIAGKLMSDEARHFKGFLTMMRSHPKPSWPRRYYSAVQRVREVEDDQTLFASHCANDDGPYDRAVARSEYLGRLYSLYQPSHLSFIESMAWRALGTDPGKRARQATHAAVWTHLQGKRASMGAVQLLAAK